MNEKIYELYKATCERAYVIPYTFNGNSTFAGNTGNCSANASVIKIGVWWQLGGTGSVIHTFSEPIRCPVTIHLVYDGQQNAFFDNVSFTFYFSDDTSERVICSRVGNGYNYYISPQRTKGKITRFYYQGTHGCYNSQNSTAAISIYPGTQTIRK